MEYEVFERENGKRARVVNSWGPLSTDSYGDGILFLIKKHREYEFPNDLNFDFNEDVFEKYGEKHDIYSLNCYIHSDVHFYIKWTQATEMFDTSKDVGYVLVPKGCPKSKVEYQINRLNSIINWDVYDIIYEEEVERTNPEYWTMTTWERYDSDFGVIGWKDVESIVNRFMKWD